MKRNRVEMKGWDFILLFQLFTNLVIIFDVPIARQIIGSLYFVFIPGFVLLRLVDLKERDMGKTCLFSIGLSVFFWMSLGLVINDVFPILGVHNPLSTWPIVIIMNLLTIVSCLVDYLLKKDFKISLQIQNLPPWIFLLACLPFLSIAGTYVVNNGGSNTLLLLLIVTISGLVLAYVLSGRIKCFSNLNCFILLMIAISLLLHVSLITNYIIGYDVYYEFYVSRLTENSLRWNSSSVSTDFSIDKVNGMLSVTIFPTIYSQISGVEGNLLFKLLYPFLFSSLTVGLYKLYRTQFDETTAFLSLFFFIANSVFFTLFSTRQMVAELFFVLLLFVLFDKKLDSSRKNMFFLIFSAGLIVSHYSLSYISMFIMFLIWLSQLIRKKPKLITTIQIVSFFVLAFGWYIYTTRGAAFTDLLNTFSFISRNFYADFLSPETRSRGVLEAVGASQTVSISHQISKVLFQTSTLLIVVGMIALIRRRKRMMSEGFLGLLSLNFSLLMLSVVVPNFAGSMGITRIYQIALLTLAPVCIIGGNTILALIPKRKIKPNHVSVLLSIYLVSFFLFQTGFVFAITGDISWSLPLNMHQGRMANLELYDIFTSKQEVHGAQWLNQKASNNTALVYADGISVSHQLTAYGMLPTEKMRRLSNDTAALDDGSYVYLRGFNIVYETVILGNFAREPLEFSFEPHNSNKIYCNGESEIYLSVIPGES